MKTTVILFLLMIPKISHSQVNYYVAKDGTGNFSTIAQVNSAALMPGDIVNFQGGQEFADAILFCKVGVTYTSYGTGKAIIGDSTSAIPTTEATIKIAVQNIIIHNLKIYGYRDAKKIISYSSGGFIISDCEIIGGQNSHRVISSGIHGESNGITDPIIITSNIIRNVVRGIYLRQPYNVEVSYNSMYNLFRYKGYKDVGGIGIQCNDGASGEAFNTDYTLHIHHNNIYNYEHSATYIGSVSRALVEYNYIHDNLDERLYMGGQKHGGFGKTWDNTGRVIGSVGNIIRYNYVYNIQRRGQPGYTYYRVSEDSIKAGLINEVYTGTESLPVYYTPESGYWSGTSDGAFGGLGYANVWVHNNILYKGTHLAFERGYTKEGGNPSAEVMPFRTDFPSYFINNTILDFGGSRIVDDSASTIKGVIHTEVTSQSPHYTINNIIDIDNEHARTASRYKEEQNYVDYNIYTNRSGSTATQPTFTSKRAAWFQYNNNFCDSLNEKYSADPGWNDTTASITLFYVGHDNYAVQIPDLRLKNIGAGYNAGKVYSLIGDTYTDVFGSHEMGKDPTGRNFAYDILGNYRTTNDIGALGSASNSQPNMLTGLKVFVEAVFTEGRMNTTLSSLNLLPGQQPFYINPWNILDNSSLISTDTSIVDWILIQLRSDSNTTIYSKPGLLISNGFVVNTDGSPFRFSSINSGEYYIVIRHRNHLDIMSSGKVFVQNNTKILYDFTTGLDKIWGTNSMAEVESGKFAMIAGDGDANGVVNVLDFSTVANNILFYGYSQGDIDMNGVINVLDYAFISRNTFKASQVP